MSTHRARPASIDPASGKRRHTTEAPAMEKTLQISKAIVDPVPNQAYQTPINVSTCGRSMPLLRLSDSGCASSGGKSRAVIGTPAASAGAASRRSVAQRGAPYGSRSAAHADGKNGATKKGTNNGRHPGGGRAAGGYERRSQTA